MISGLLGKKIGMTQIFDKEGNVVPVTALEVGPCFVLGLKDAPKKVVIGFDRPKLEQLIAGAGEGSRPRFGQPWHGCSISSLRAGDRRE